MALFAALRSEALGNLGEAKPMHQCSAVPDLFNFVNDTDKAQAGNLRSSAAYALGNFGAAAKPFIPDILNFGKDKTQDDSVWGWAVVAIGNLGDAAKPFSPDIGNILKDKTPYDSVRVSAAVALSNLGEAATPFIPDILTFAKDRPQNVYVTDRVSSSPLSNLGEAAKPFSPDIANILKDKTQNYSVRNSAAEALCNLGEASQTVKSWHRQVSSKIRHKMTLFGSVRLKH